MKLPMNDGILIRPLVAALILYGGDWNTAPHVVSAAMRNPSVEANVRNENIVAGYNIIGMGRINMRK
jgi:hypothetical protein